MTLTALNDGNPHHSKMILTALNDGNPNSKMTNKPNNPHTVIKVIRIIRISVLFRQPALR